MDIRPVAFTSPPDRPTVTAQLRAHRHGILTSAEIVAGVRELLREQGEEYAGLAEILSRVEPHLTWAMGRLDEVAERLEALGWKPPSFRSPKQSGVQGLPGWQGDGEP